MLTRLFFIRLHQFPALPRRFVGTILRDLIRSTFLLVLICIGYFSFAFNSTAAHAEVGQHGNFAYELSPAELLKLKQLAQAGDCDASYKIGRHHLFVSLDYDEAVKYFRIAAKCSNVDAMMSLIVVLRGPKNDAEVDALLRDLKTLDELSWKDAAEEVANQRLSRKSR